MKLIIFLLFFLNIWSLQFVFLPVRPEFMLAIPGFFCFMTRCKAEHIKVLLLLFIPLFYSLLIGFCFGTYQFGLAQMFAGEICRFFGFLFLVEAVNRYSKLTGEDLILLVCKYYICAIMLNIGIGVYFAFFNQDLLTFINSEFVCHSDEVLKNKVLYLDRFKLLGTKNFTPAAALAYAASLLILHFVLCGYWKIKLKIMLSFILLFVTSFFLGRSVLVFYTCALPFFLRREAFRVVIPLVIFMVIGMFAIVFFLPENILRFAFEPIYALLEEGELRSDSTDDLFFMWSVKADSLSGWLLGEGYWLNGDGSYYKKTDAGYLRSILYWGILGTIICFGSVLAILRIIFKTVPPRMRRLVILFTFVWLVYNLKVFCLPIGIYGGLLVLIFFASSGCFQRCAVKNSE